MNTAVSADAFDAWSARALDAVESALRAWVPADAPAGLGEVMRGLTLGVVEQSRSALPGASTATTCGRRPKSRGAVRSSAACRAQVPSTMSPLPSRTAKSSSKCARH